MPWDKLPVLPTFERARRREIYQKLASAVRGEDHGELLSLDEMRRRLRLFDQRYIGIEPIPVSKIVGTSERRPDFGPGFLPKDFETRERWRRVEQAFPHGDFPPIVVYRVTDLYFVVDGHHRVAVAKQRGVEYIDAEITELDSRYPLDPDVDIAEIIHEEQRRMFMAESGLAEARPGATIEFSRALGYVELLDLVKVFGYHLIMERGEIMAREAIAERWYEDVYLPTLAAIHREDLVSMIPGTEGDLFLWVYQRRQALFPEHGGMTMEEAARRSKSAD
jgi:hypothetical protein